MMSSRKHIARSRPTDAWRVPPHPNLYLAKMPLTHATGPDRQPIVRSFCLPSQQSAERAADERAADRAAKLATDRLAEIGHDAADHLAGHRARDVARDALAGR